MVYITMYSTMDCNIRPFSYVQSHPTTHQDSHDKQKSQKKKNESIRSLHISKPIESIVDHNGQFFHLLFFLANYMVDLHVVLHV